jgi:diketogulonate reductase-like aldo/keto reductase
MTNPTLVIMAEKYGCTTAQLMVRWSIQKGYVPLPKSVKRERIVENANIGGFEISDEDMNALDMLNEFCKETFFSTDSLGSTSFLPCLRGPAEGIQCHTDYYSNSKI